MDGWTGEWMEGGILKSAIFIPIKVRNGAGLFQRSYCPPPADVGQAPPMQPNKSDY